MLEFQKASLISEFQVNFDVFLYENVNFFSGGVGHSIHAS